MGVILAMAFLVVVAVVAIALLAVRTWMVDEERVEEHMRAPGTHKMEYVVPDGEDAALAMAALAAEGFTVVADSTGGSERLLIACEDVDHARVRRIIARAHGMGTNESIV